MSKIKLLYITNGITILDGFRVIAILVVLLFYFHYRFEGTKYHYMLGFTHIFSFGRLGVHFFFIISGFVITLTLQSCTNYLEFLKKRFIGLVPAMFVCSILTFSIFSIFDSSNLFPVSHSFGNLLISNTFINPSIINFLLGTKTAYLDGAYWSLWVEICFYLIIGLVYFYNESKLLKNFAIISFRFILMYLLCVSSSLRQIFTPYFGFALFDNCKIIVEKFFNIFGLSNWFLLGIILFRLYHNKSIKLVLFFTILFIFQTILVKGNVSDILFLFFVYILLLLFVYNPEKIAFLGSKVISKLGIVSYSVYLIHENIGVLIINKLSLYFGNTNWLIGLFLIVFFFLFGIFSYNRLEKPLGKILKKILFS